eukprot:3675458-Rhodomonas_salina.2
MPRHHSLTCRVLCQEDATAEDRAAANKQLDASNGILVPGMSTLCPARVVGLGFPEDRIARALTWFGGCRWIRRPGGGGQDQRVQ